MQESTTIQWDPMYEGQHSWPPRLFIIYLAVVLLVFCFQAIRMLWYLRGLRKAAKESTVFSLAWDSCQARTVSIKNWLALTFLLSFLVSAWSMTGTLRGISMQKVTGTAFLAGATAEVLMTFCLGMLVCALPYSFAFFYETLLVRYKSRQPYRGPTSFEISP